MTGITTLTGRFSSAVGTTHDASKVIPCIVILLLAAKPPSPEVVHDKAPVPPGSVFLYDHIDPSWPMMFRIASCCQLPASRPAPGLQARKGGRQIEKTHNTEGLGSENISMFFSNSIANRKGFLPRPALFRAWTGASEAGKHNAPGLPDITGHFLGADYNADSWESFTGAFRDAGWTDTGVVASGTQKIERAIDFRASFSNPIYGTSATVMPLSVNVPCIIYLGLNP